VIVAWVAFPLALAALCAGLGLLADALSGRRLPGALVAPAGLVTMVALGGLATLAGAGIALTATALIVAAGLGPLAALPWRFGRPDPWAAGAALAVFVLFAAPVVLSGDPTFAVYGDAATMAEWLSLLAGDPGGPLAPIAVLEQLLGGEAAWYLQPYLALLGALIALTAWQFAVEWSIYPRKGGSKVQPTPGGVSLGPRACALVAFLAAVPALIFGYAGPLSALSLDVGPWLALATLLALCAATFAVAFQVASTQPPAALALLAAALAACALFASANLALAPYERLEELRGVDERFAGEGPALIVERNPLAPYFLGDLAPDGAVDPEAAGLPARSGEQSGGEEPFDTDQFDFEALLAYPLLIVPRSEAHSRPPLPYRRAWQGEDYEVWRLPPTATFRLLHHMSIGGPLDAAGLPDCSQTVGLGLLVLANQLGAAPQDVVIVAAAPRRGDRLGPTVAVPPDRTRELCGRPWDWIEAIAPSSSGS
jgi:hypothetical protein